MTPATQLRLLASVGLVLLLVVVRRMALAAVFLRVQDPGAQYRWRRSTTYGAALLGLLVLARIWLADTGGYATYLGPLSAGLAIALKDPLTSLAGWIFILWRRPFEVGDRVQIGDHAGDVVDIRLFQFTLLEIGRWVQADQSTGRLIHLPNALIFTTPLANYTRGFRERRRLRLHGPSGSPTVPRRQAMGACEPVILGGSAAPTGAMARSNCRPRRLFQAN